MDGTKDIVKEVLADRNRKRGRFGIDVTEHKLTLDFIECSYLKSGDVEKFVNSATEADRTLIDQAQIEQICSTDELNEVLGRVFNMKTIQLDNIEFDFELASKIDGTRARSMQAIPIARNDHNIPIVAIADPASTTVRDDIPRLLGVEEVELRIASLDSVEAAIDRVYDKTYDDDASEAFQQMGEESDEEEMRVSAAEDSPAARLVNALLTQAQNLGASDVHLQPNKDSAVVRMRVDALLEDVRDLPKAAHEQAVRRIKHMGEMKTHLTGIPQDGRASLHVPGLPPLDVRIATMPTVHGEKITMRLMDSSVNELNIAQLGLSPRNLTLVRTAMRSNHGAIIVTGPTGSGKTTTMYALIRELNDRDHSIITVEDPVEQRIPGVDQVQINEEQKLGFASMLRSILRNDPDTIMVGELRDSKPAQIAMEAANTGHLVLATMHANTALMAISRLSELGVSPFRIATQLKVATAQRLCRKVCSCRVKADRDPAYLASMNVPEDLIEEIVAGKHLLFKASPTGCARCSNRGYRGRIGMHEVLPITKPIQKQILRDAEDVDALRDLAEDAGYRSFFLDGIDKVLQGETTLEELHRAIDED